MFCDISVIMQHDGKSFFMFYKMIVSSTTRKRNSKVLKTYGRYYCDVFPSSTTRIIKNSTCSENNLNEEKLEEKTKSNSEEFRVNEFNIQMISKNIYDQLFKTPSRPLEPQVIKSCQADLKKHGIDYKQCEHLPDIEINLPKLAGADIEEHFYNIGEKHSIDYRKHLEELASCELPPMPKVWSKTAGWTRYTANSLPQTIPCPPDDALVFDVEVLMTAGKRPTLACAVSPHAWYSWISKSLANNEEHKFHPDVTYESLIPLETDQDDMPYGDLDRPRVVVGHNVSYDRSKVKEQYRLNRSGLRFMDTMSMHTCVSGVTSYQRAVLKSKNKDPSAADEGWMDISSLNSLTEVHRLYCGSPLNKDPRDTFVSGSLSSVQADFQGLMTYCARDVTATWRVLTQLLPLFLERFPHPLTMAGMLDLGSTYLPINSNWLRYIESAETVFEDLKLESRQLLSLKADEACRLMAHDLYKKDLWMWDQDWSVQNLKLKKQKVRKNKAKKEEIGQLFEESKHPQKDMTGQFSSKHARLVKYTEKKRIDEELLNENYIKLQSLKYSYKYSTKSLEDLSKKFQYLYDLKELLPAKKPFLPGYPAWYRKLCTKPGKDPDWSPGANNITTSMQITPKLLRLSWEGYPLHHTPEDKWGFLVPFTRDRPVSYEPVPDEPQIPLEELVRKCPVVWSSQSNEYGDECGNRGMERLAKKVEEDMGKRTYYARRKLDEKAAEYKYNGLGVWCGTQLQGCCHFLRLPHKDGPKHKVGNPLARDYLDMFSQNVLTAQGDEAEKVLKFGRMMSYWRNNRERIMGQQAVWLPPHLAPTTAERGTARGDQLYGAILPQVVAAGTLTRRASEPTWMTASNAHSERVGSELRAMTQAPPGYSFVGADVDSQELWIAALLGDSGHGAAGATPFGWSVLAGDKPSGTDLHSLTASAAAVSRDHAKVVNYARIYGAGQNFAERLLKQFNPTFTNAEAKSKAMKMYQTTKGRRVYQLKEKYMEGFMDEDLSGQVVEMTSYQAMRLAKLSGKRVEDMFDKPKWVGGTESAMFNKLEEIADSEEPKTAFLQGRLSRALESEPGRWDGTKQNWAVQSAAADFLHLMLASMRSLAPAARFCLSFHDEVRYLVPDEYKYETALALQITNLLTRAFCSQRVGIRDLPLSVAFFTSVEVDRVLRKEAHLDCTTPSNPHGLARGYGIPNGESLTIADVLQKFNNKKEWK